MSKTNRTTTSPRLASPNIEYGHTAEFSKTASVNLLFWDHSFSANLKKLVMAERHKCGQESVRDLHAILAKKEEIKKAEIDSVTGLPNRAVFERDLRASYERESQNNKPRLVVSIIDLNGLKRVNEKLGHIEGGDKYLKGVATAVETTLRPEDDMYRIGGDELAIIRRDAPEELDELDERVRTSVSDSPEMAEIGITLELYAGSISIGSQRLEHGQTIDELVIYADNNLHADKLAFNAGIPQEVLEQDSRRI